MTIVASVATVVSASASTVCAWVGIKARKRRAAHMYLVERRSESMFGQRVAHSHLDFTRLIETSSPYDLQHILDMDDVGFASVDVTAVSEGKRQIHVTFSEGKGHATVTFIAAHSRQQRISQIKTLLPAGRRPHDAKVDVPMWALGLMTAEDACRYEREWGAHLHQQVAEGDIKQARRDRRRMAFAAIKLAIALRVRLAFGRTR
jgi:hypothetical protein